MKQFFTTAREEKMNTLATGSNTNGAGAPRPPETPMKATTRPRDARQARFGQTFSQIVAVLMRDPNFRHLRLADLEWLVLPPVMAGQFRLGHATRPADGGKPEQGGISIPVAVALWARVSPEIDKALSENLDKQVRLRADEWATGENLWLMAAAGDKRAVPLFLKQLAETEFKDQHVKMRLRGTDGKTMVKTLGESA